MGGWKKAPQALQEAFLAALPAREDVEPKRMFGYPCAFVNGNMFAGLHEGRMIVRLPEEAVVRPCVIMGRTMKEYALFAAAEALPPDFMAAWIERGYDYTRGLPANAPRVPKAGSAPEVPKAKVPRKPKPR